MDNFDEKIKEEKRERTRYDINIAFMPVFIILLTEFIVDWIQSGTTTIFQILKISIPLLVFCVLRFNLKHSKNP
jgi:hypothetical protein